MFTSGFASSYDTSVSASHGHVRASSSNMPFIELQSNLPAGQFSEAFLKRLCSSTAAALGKPEDVSTAHTHEPSPTSRLTGPRASAARRGYVSADQLSHHPLSPDPRTTGDQSQAPIGKSWI